MTGMQVYILRILEFKENDWPNEKSVQPCIDSRWAVVRTGVQTLYILKSNLI